MLWAWAIFLTFVLLMLGLDLGVFHRKAHVVGVREALGWSAVWLALGLSFALFVYFAYEGKWFGLGTAVDAVDGLTNDGRLAAEKYVTGYVIEKSLSVDNIFVISMIFSFFAVPPIHQHRVLYWGILGALLLRGVMIGVGATLIAEFHWVLYVFAAFLIVTALKMLFLDTSGGDPGGNVAVRIARKLFPVTPEFHGERFVVRAPPGRLLLTPLALALVVVETSDVVFAVDSIPAIFAVTADPFLVFTSNVFAILGLRSLYFVLADMARTFRYLKAALALVLLVVGLKMVLTEWLKAALGEHWNLYLLAAVLIILAAGVLASLAAARKDAAGPDRVS